MVSMRNTDVVIVYNIFRGVAKASVICTVTDTGSFVVMVMVTVSIIFKVMVTVLITFMATVMNYYISCTAIT